MNQKIMIINTPDEPENNDNTPDEPENNDNTPEEPENNDNTPDEPEDIDYVPNEPENNDNSNGHPSRLTLDLSVFTRILHINTHKESFFNTQTNALIQTQTHIHAPAYFRIMELKKKKKKKTRGKRVCKKNGFSRKI